MAYAMYDDIEVRTVASSTVQVEVHGEGAGKVATDHTHLVARALLHTLDYVGAPLAGLRMTCFNSVPHGRGLGSSAAATVAGIMAARELLAEPESMDLNTVLAIATEFEGHPDNAAPAIAGTATVAWQDERGPSAAVLEVDEDIVPTLVIPRAELLTATARAALPATVPHTDAAFNVGRAALLVEALARRPELLFDATEDKLHQPYRTAVMGESAEILGQLRASGFAAVISGAGPTVLVLSTAAQLPAMDACLTRLLGPVSGWKVKRPGIDTLGAQARRITAGHSR
jgi:homoserine kinase